MLESRCEICKSEIYPDRISMGKDYPVTHKIAWLNKWRQPMSLEICDECAGKVDRYVHSLMKLAQAKKPVSSVGSLMMERK